ncbi:hypothetical protein [Myxococcus sp. RHSTA-1-4]|uniref:hypothetical protein n=1 Tax=Myxococcus sp. RHSTA-1-4 TaxID=2874601 RepID=UPI001CBEDFE1|nr:hypothetical protein [Myxococcus sp. RHSTA-1-4]MBZ4418387.1 hypothetical protein [Myxococcus sp. RHSTA-1-4]
MAGPIKSNQPFTYIPKPASGTQASKPQAPAPAPAVLPKPAATGQGGTASAFTDGFGGGTRTSSLRNPLFPQDNGAVFLQGGTPPPVTPTPEEPDDGPISLDAGVSGSVTVGPNGVSAQAGAELGVSVEGGPFSLTVGAYTEVGASRTTEGDMTTFNVEAEVGVKGEAGVEAGIVSGNVNGSAGVRASYEVTMPTSAAEGITSPEQAAQLLNPFEPENLPVGTTITLHGESFVQTGMSVTFQNIARVFDLSVSDSVERAQGMSIAVNKVDENTVRVTIGPTEMVSRTGSVGLAVGGVGVELASTGTVNQQTARQVDFDISTPEGRAAYDHFMATGELPGNDPANGTSNAATVQVISGEATQELTLGISFGESSLASDEYVFTTYDDGRQEFAYTGTLGPVTFQVSGDVNDPSTHTYQATLTDVNAGSVDGLSQLYPNTGTGGTVTMSFTAEEAAQMQQLAKDWVQAHEEGRPGYADPPPEWVMNVANAESPEAAISWLMTPTMNNDSTTVVDRVNQLGIFQLNNGGGEMPGTVIAQ